MFHNALVRRPAASMTKGITSHPEFGVPDHALALRQHEAYVKTLESCGLKVEVLPPMEAFPDSCFVEDVAVCTRKFALVSAPGTASRAGEVAGIVDILPKYFKDIVRIKAPGTLDGGDVMMVGDLFFIGLSARTNREGAAQFIAALEAHGFRGETVAMPETLHLKTGLSYLEEGFLMVGEDFRGNKRFEEFHRIFVPAEESYAANSLRVNDYVIVPSGFPKTAAAIRAAGLKIIETDVSEFRKLDGGLSCLSLRF